MESHKIHVPNHQPVEGLLQKFLSTLGLARFPPDNSSADGKLLRARDRNPEAHDFPTRKYHNPKKRKSNTESVHVGVPSNTANL